MEIVIVQDMTPSNELESKFLNEEFEVKESNENELTLRKDGRMFKRYITKPRKKGLKPKVNSLRLEKMRNCRDRSAQIIGAIYRAKNFPSERVMQSSLRWGSEWSVDSVVTR